jgi:outer membrane receptor protein involved in Fe transport
MIRTSPAGSRRDPKRPLAIAVAVALGALHAGAVLGQESETKLKEMKVSAESDKPVQQRTELGRMTEFTPLSGTVVERKELEHLNAVNNLMEIGKRVPGFSMVRNMRIPDGGKNYTENRVDGLRVSSTSNSSLLDEVDGSNIERFEVITGPGSALYGSGALAGTLSVTTRLPPKEFAAKLSQEAGSWGFTRTNGNIGRTTEDGRFGFLVNASTMDNEGWRKNLATGASDSAEEHKDGVALRALFRLTDSTKLTVGVDRLHYDFQLPGAIPLNATEAAKLKNGVINGRSLRSVDWSKDWQETVPGTNGRTINEYETWSANLQQLVGARGEFSLAWSQRTDEELGGGAGGSGGTRSVICDNVTVTCATYNTGSAASTNTVSKSRTVVRATRPMYRQEFDFAKSTLYLGMELSDVRTDSTKHNNNFTARQAQTGMWGLGTMTATGQGSITREKNSTPFVHVEFSPLDRLRLHLGQRFDRITYATDDRTAANKDAGKTFSKGIWKNGATYDLGNGHLIWGSIAETFNAPGVATLLDSSAKGTIGNTIGAELKPEEALTHEIGFRGLFRDLGLRYDVALYQTVNKGFVVTRDCDPAETAALNLGAACSIRENVGGLTATGLESVLSWAVNDWLDLGATYANAKAYYNNDNRTNAGKSYMYMPRVRMNLRLAVKPAPGWKIELEQDHFSSYFINAANTDAYSRPDLYSLRASYRSKAWSFWLHAINLTDQKYTTRVSASTIAGVSVLATSAGQGNSGSYTPLTLRAGLSYQF